MGHTPENESKVQAARKVKSHTDTEEFDYHLVWHSPGCDREIFYRSEDKMLAVAVEARPALRLSKPRLLFEERLLREEEGVVGFAQYDVAPDGDHFVMIREKESLSVRIHIVLNWAEELKEQVPPVRR